jgi:flagellar biosynthesis anti-sigma factor FlgM
VPPSGDDLVLSSRAQEFQKVRPRIDGLATGAGSRRIEELRAAIANGTYRVDAQRIAAAVLRDEAVGPLLEQPE